eukprot:CAMPEP_0184505320 /NCGR_PEP_ID=MMETSP0113_2-20130426/52927_1 /TAXON_ID=91329 /ORGANISM="Norrisiella sphaerica, Strain BC52" /LENGTH=101 /DNA_ID=CAMNT_0026895007 /DNA_START=1095 /DNA_END=1397 /DNA_ORIENTATION=-
MGFYSMLLSQMGMTGDPKLYHAPVQWALVISISFIVNRYFETPMRARLIKKLSGSANSSSTRSSNGTSRSTRETSLFERIEDGGKRGASELKFLFDSVEVW